MKKTLKPKVRYVYWWGLNDRSKPTVNGAYSAKNQNQGECASFRYKALSWLLHPNKMGGGIGTMFRAREPKWIYPRPNSIDGHILKIVCTYAK